jgi:U3 small nucleolar RNA-associated protein 19
MALAASLDDLIKTANTSKDHPTIFEAIKNIYKAVATLLENKEVRVDYDKAARHRVNAHKQNQLDAYIKTLLQLLGHTEAGLQIPALKILMNLVKQEGSEQHLFRNSLYPKVVNGLVNNPNINTALMSTLKDKYFIFYDVLYYTLLNLSIITSERAKKSENSAEPTRDNFVSNVFELLQATRIPSADAQLDSFFVYQPSLHQVQEDVEEAPSKRRKGKDGDPKKQKQQKEKLGGVVDPAAHRKLWSACWINLAKLRLPKQVHKLMLLYLPDKVLPVLRNPRMLLDFFITSYDAGGVYSLLALNGVYTMMARFNLDYPDFYKKFYVLFTPTIFQMKYRARFFRMALLFLSSSYLPSSLVAAFIKKLCRLALTAPVDGCMSALALVYNLLARHPVCIELIHRTPKDQPTNRILLLTAQLNEGEGKGEDPFVMDEPDPEKSNALQSSLWELQALKNHCVPSVSKLAKIFDQEEISKIACDLEDFVDQNYESLFTVEIKRRAKKIPLEFRFEPEVMQDPLGCWSFK